MNPNIFRIRPESRELKSIDITLSNPVSYGIHVPIVPIFLHDTSNSENNGTHPMRCLSLVMVFVHEKIVVCIITDDPDITSSITNRSQTTQ